MFHLIINTYKSDNAERQKEMDFCLDKNRQLPFLNIHDIQPRPTYNDLFRATWNFSDDDIFIFANNDIYFDESLLFCKDMPRGHCYALSRWDVTARGIKHFCRPDSQDVWIFKGRVPVMQGADFYQGVAGCDNAIAHIIDKNGYVITNPSLSIKTYHVHNSGVRSFKRGIDKVIPSPYKMLPITYL